jgi:hypothetical protein
MITNKSNNPLFKESLLLQKMNICEVTDNTILKAINSKILQTPYYTIFPPNKPISKLIDFTKFSQEIELLS